jgi:hypothetical protein
MNCKTALFAIVAFTTGADSAFAASRDDTLEAVARCASIIDDKLRLGCYDSMAPHVRDALGMPPNALTGTPTQEEQKSWFGFDIGGLFGSEKTPETTPQSFGQESVEKKDSQPSAPEMQEIDSITAGVTDYSFRSNKFLVFLDNGQIWEQLNGDEGLAVFKKNPKDNSVVISRGFLKSYNLKLNGENFYYKVKRFK